MQRIHQTYEYLRPKTLSECVSVLSKHGEKARLLAGGTDLVLLLKREEIRPQYVIDLTSIPNMSYINYDQKSGLRIGAMTTVRAIEESTIIREKYTALQEAANILGVTQVRNVATVVGNLCNASPAADTAPPLLVLNAELKVMGATGRMIPLNKFFLEPGKSALRPDELVTEIQVPTLPSASGTAFIRLGRIKHDLSKVSAAVCIAVRGSVCEAVRIALGAVGPTPIRAREAEETLRHQEIKEETITKAADVASKAASPITDVRSTAEYRRKMSGVLVKRAIVVAATRAGLKGLG